MRLRKSQKPVETAEQLEERKFLFGVSMNLGNASNNYAEYCGMLYALIISNFFGQSATSIFSDSELVVTQVKGHAKVRNPILSTLVENIHDLLYSFRAVNLNYLERELNGTADRYANYGAVMDQDFMVSFDLIDVISQVS